MLKLKVGEALKKDVGKKIVRIDSKIMKENNITTGDYVKIINEDTGNYVLAIVWPAHFEDRELNIIRMDGILRENCKVKLGDFVRVEKVELSPIKKIVFAYTEKDVKFSSTFSSFLKGKLIGKPLKKGEIIRIDLFDRSFDFVVESCSPKEGYIDDKTNVIVSDKPAKSLKVKKITYEDIGGLKEELRRIREIVELPLKYPELFEKLGIEPPKGVLLYGPPGTGKTLLAKAVANETDAHFIYIAGPEIMSKFIGEAEEKLRQIFEEAEKKAPSIIFIDEIDAIAPKREDIGGDVERRIVAQLLTLMDGLKERGKVIVIGATNMPNVLDPALRRPGRFDRELEIGVPDREGRKEILQIHTRGMPLDKDVDLDKIAELTHGYTGADLSALCKEAALECLREVIPEIDLEKEELPPEILDKLVVRMDHFMKALGKIQPSALREVLVEIPKVKWEDIGGLEDVKKQLKEVIELPLKQPEKFEKFGIRPIKGVLLYGPPGTGKTLLAKAVANESNANFISVKGPELLSKWVGESIPGDEKVLAKINGEIKLIEIEKLYKEWKNKKSIEVVSIVNGKVKWSKIDHISRHLRSSPIVEIVTQSGRKVKVTLDHSIFKVDKNKIVSVPTSEMKEGDWIVLVNNIPSGDKDEIFGIKINENIATLIGLFLSEGDINREYVRIHNNNKEIIEEIDRIVKEENLNGKYYWKDGSYWIKDKWFVKICKKIVGTGAKNKKLGTLLSLKKNLLAKILKGYFSGDGSFYLKNHKRSAEIEAITVSKTLAEELLITLSMFGIFARIKRKINRVGNEEFRILIGRTEFFDIFLKNIGFIQKNKNDKIKEFIKSRKWTRGTNPKEIIGNIYVGMEVEYYSDRIIKKYLKKIKIDDLYFDKIKEIKYLNRNDMYVYDVVEVEEGHNFLGGNGILLHNSEKGIREIFRKAKMTAPCIIFFDEIDSIAPKRGNMKGVTDTMVNQLLTEMNGIEDLKNVFVIAATNRPDILDPALLRPGRFDKLIYVPEPDKEMRKKILEVLLRKTPKKGIDLEYIAEKTEWFSGADLEALVIEAALYAIRHNKEYVDMECFENALKEVKPSLSKEIVEKYKEFNKKKVYEKEDVSDLFV